MFEPTFGHFCQLAKKRKSSKAVGERSGPAEKKGRDDNPPALMMTLEPTLGASEFSLSLVDNSQAQVVVPTQSVKGLEAAGESRQGVMVTSL